MSWAYRTLLVAVVVASFGCNDEDNPPAVYPDTFIPADGNAQFLSACTDDGDCVSGHCVQLGDARRCSRPCSSSAPCPGFPEWSCNSQSFCECSGTGAQPTVCNVDGDCDGVADRTPTKEICNGEDDDCNNAVDDVGPNASGATQYYRDGDGDGFGDETQTKWLCQPEAGWITKVGDCDDTRKSDNPDAVEVCDDGRDNDCNFINDDPDVCGLTPISVPDVNGSDSSAVLKTCTTTPGLQKSLDITEIIGKQDNTAIKLTVRLAGNPATATCTSYILRLGDPQQSGFDLVYIYRPGITACGAIPSVEAYLKGQPLTTGVVTAFNAADPGHVSFVLDKAEIFPHLPQPTYKLEACVNATADVSKDKTDCTDDSCEAPIHR